MVTVKPTSLVVCLHGLGGDGSQFKLLRGMLQGAMPRMAVSTPNAPGRADGGPGYQWFGLAGITDENRAKRLAEARVGLDGLLTREIVRAGFADKLDRVVLLGFSQGALMALDAVASGNWPITSVVSFAGRLITPDPLTPTPRLRALLLHGQDDQVIVPQYLNEASIRLRMSGVQVERHLLSGVGHDVTPEAAYITLGFLWSVMGS